MAKNKKIPVFNDTFDLSKLNQVIKKNLIFYVIFIGITIFSSYTYLRYTPPVYETYTVLQVNEEKNSSFIEIENVYGQTSLTNLIELLRSREFLKRTIVKLNLHTCYYLEGKFLTTELYKNSPFFVETENFPDDFKNKNIYIKYDSKNEDLILNVELSDNNTFTTTVKKNTWSNIQGGKIYINITNVEQLKNQTSLTQGNNVFFKILDDNGAFAQHLQGLNISILNSSAGTIQVYYTSNNAQKTSDIVNTISEDFLTYNIEKKQERAQKILTFIEEQLQIVYEKLDESETQLQNFKKANKISGNILNDQSAIALNYKKRSEELDNYKSQLTYLNRINSQIKTDNNINAVELITLLSSGPNESMILNFLRGIDQLQKEKEKLLVNVTEDNHRVKILNQQIAEQKALLNEITNLSMDRIKSEIEAASQVEDAGEEVEINEIELTKLQRIHSVHQNYYDQLVQKKAEYMISKAGHVTNNLILQKASVPSSPISPIPSYIIFISIVLCFLSIFTLTLIRYMLHNHIMGINDISRFTEVPVGGVIPVTKETNKINRFVVENKANSVITEAFRTLRSNLEFMHQEKNDKKIIAITSTISGEGKTFIAINLGGVFSLSGKRVILLDLDLRKPKVHLTFKATNDRGLSTILIGKDNYKDCIIETEFENFNIITSGPPPPNPAELANSDNFDNLLLELKKEYDVIIVDTPPIGIVSDAIFSFKRADLPIYVTRANYSKRNFINNVNYVKEHKKISNISIVLNAVEIISSKYGYGYKGYGYGGYGYGYGYGFGYGYYSYGEEKKKQSKKPKGWAIFFKK